MEKAERKRLLAEKREKKRLRKEKKLKKKQEKEKALRELELKELANEETKSNGEGEEAEHEEQKEEKVGEKLVIKEATSANVSDEDVESKERSKSQSYEEFEGELQEFLREPQLSEIKPREVVVIQTEDLQAEAEAEKSQENILDSLEINQEMVEPVKLGLAKDIPEEEKVE